MRAIAHRDGPAMVLAGPGSGKTFVITERIRYLIEEYHIPPSQILTITFTKAAALQMQHRFADKTDNRYADVSFGTFHSCFFKMLRDFHAAAGKEPLTILTDREKRALLKMLLSDEQERDRDMQVTDELVEAYLSEIGRAKNSGEETVKENPMLPYGSHFPRVYAGYLRMQRSLGKADFEDMISLCLQMFREHPEVLSFWQNRFRYLQVDEYQDVNQIQAAVIAMLAGKRGNLLVVGDDDQSIYAFRGSDPSCMRRFKESYPEADVYALEMNYRCRREIIDASGMVITENKNRIQKVQKAGREECGAVLLKPFPTAEKERAEIASGLSGLSNNQDTFALIVRTHAAAEQLSCALQDAGIPVAGSNTRESLPFSGQDIQDMLAYLRLASRNPTREDFFRIMNRPNRFLSRECARGEPFRPENLEEYYRGQPSMCRVIKKLVRDLHFIGGMRPSLAVRYIRTQVGYDAFLCGSLSPDDLKAAMKRLDAFLAEASGFGDTNAFLLHITQRREAAEKNARKAPSKSDGVRILTMHASKGLEFDTVWLPGLNEGIMPARRIVLPEQFEEERRLLYVAMTRARKTLILSWITGTENAACMPSRFLRPLLSTRLCDKRTGM